MNRRPAGPVHIGLKHQAKAKRNLLVPVSRLLQVISKGPGSGRDPEGESNASKISL